MLRRTKAAYPFKRRNIKQTALVPKQSLIGQRDWFYKHFSISKSINKCSLFCWARVSQRYGVCEKILNSLPIILIFLACLLVRHASSIVSGIHNLSILNIFWAAIEGVKTVQWWTLGWTRGAVERVYPQTCITFVLSLLFLRSNICPERVNLIFPGIFLKFCLYLSV